VIQAYDSIQCHVLWFCCWKVFVEEHVCHKIQAFISSLTEYVDIVIYEPLVSLLVFMT
jgi:hypothetical protein